MGHLRVQKVCLSASSVLVSPLVNPLLLLGQPCPRSGLGPQKLPCWDIPNSWVSSRSWDPHSDSPCQGFLLVSVVKGHSSVTPGHDYSTTGQMLCFRGYSTSLSGAFSYFSFAWCLLSSFRLVLLNSYAPILSFTAPSKFGSSWPTSSHSYSEPHFVDLLTA